MSPAHIQPIASDDVADAVAAFAVAAPVNGTVELAGPECFQLDALVRQFLRASGDARRVVSDDRARYFGAELNDQSLTPGQDARIAPTLFLDWLSRSIQRKAG